MGFHLLFRPAVFAIALMAPCWTLAAASKEATDAPSFADLVASVAKPPAADHLSPDAEAVLRYRTSAEGVKARQALVKEKACLIDPDYNKPNGKQTMRVDIARLQKDITDKKALANVVLVAPFEGKDAHFTKIMLAHLYGRFGPQLPPNVQEALRKQAASYPEYLGVATENHIGMQRVSAAIFGAAYPEMKTVYGISGKELEAMGEDYIKRYGRTVFHSGMKEFLSPIYLGAHNEIWLTAADYAPTEPARLMSRAMLDWLWTDLAVNSNLGQVMPPAMRAKLMLDAGAQTIYPQSHAQWLAWLYWGDLRSRPGGETLSPNAASITAGTSVRDVKEDKDGFQTAVIPATVSRIPDEVIRNIGAKNLALPYMLLQSRPHGEVTTSVGDNAFSPSRPRPFKDLDRNFLRSVYVARDYSLSAGYVRKDDSGDNEPSMHLFPTALNYRTTDTLNSIIVSHPYWYSGTPTGNALEANKVFGLDCWLGKSPFEQVVHWENTAIYLYDIPDVDPNVTAEGGTAKKEDKVKKEKVKKEKEGKDKKDKRDKKADAGKAAPAKADAAVDAAADDDNVPVKGDRGKWTATRAQPPLKKVCVYVPEAIDETRQTEWGWFLREGNVFVALRPINAQSAQWQKCPNPVQAGYKRLILEGSLMGLIVEVGDANEYGSADAFLAKVGAAAVDLSQLASKKQLSYVSSRNIPLRLRFDPTGRFPDASVRSAKLDFEHWPICESPYVTCRDGVLDANDGQKGFTIDWHGESPTYSRYAMVDGKRQLNGTK